MNKKQFLSRLNRALHKMKPAERRQSVAYYAELIDDGMENGLSEAEAVEKCGDADRIAEEILSDAGMADTIKPKGDTAKTVLIAAGSPLWMVFACAAAAVLLVLYVTMWAVLIALYAVLVAVFAAGLAGVLQFVLQLLAGAPATAFMMLGAGLICVGLGLLLTAPIVQLSKLFVKGTISSWKWVWNKAKGGTSK